MLTAPIFLIVCVGVILSWAAFSHFKETTSLQRSMEFARLAQTQTESINTHISKSVALLRSIRGLFDSSKQVSRSNFGVFVKSLEIGSTVQALEWIPRVRKAEREKYEKQAQEQGLSGFAITQRRTQGMMVPASERAEYFPVFYVEPLQGNESAIGFDLASNPARLKALHLARDSGEMIATSRITLVQENSNQYGFLAFVPIYENGRVPNNVDERRKQLLGFGLGVYRVGNLIKSALHLPPDGASDLNIYVYDTSSPAGTRLLYPKGAEGLAKRALAAPIHYERRIKVAGRMWSIIVSPSRNSAFIGTQWYSWAVLLAGLLTTTLLSLYYYSIAMRSAYAEKLVQERTAALQYTNASLEEAKEKLKKIAHHDPLTGLANRRQFENQFNRAFEVAQRDSRNLVVLMIDLDAFKEVNDRLGHQAGDEVLCEMARRLQESVRGADLVARMGGDEFAVLMEGGAKLQGAVILANKISNAVMSPISVKGRSVNVGMSIGIAVFPDHGNDVDSLINCADSAMYRAKNSGKAYAIFANEEEIFMDAESRHDALQTA